MARRVPSVGAVNQMGEPGTGGSRGHVSGSAGEAGSPAFTMASTMKCPWCNRRVRIQADGTLASHMLPCAGAGADVAPWLDHGSTATCEKRQDCP